MADLLTTTTPNATNSVRGSYGEYFLPTLTSQQEEEMSSLTTSFSDQLSEILAATQEISSNSQEYQIDPADFLAQSIFGLVDQTNALMAEQTGVDQTLISTGEELWQNYADNLNNIISGTDPVFQDVVQNAVNSAVAPTISQSLQTGLPTKSTYATIAATKAGTEAGASAANDMRTTALAQLPAALEGMNTLQTAPYTGLLAAKATLPTEYTSQTGVTTGTTDTSSSQTGTTATSATEDKYVTGTTDLIYQQPVTFSETSDGSSSGGCCWIFLEARYGDGTMDAVVRKARDEEVTPRMRRGYYKLSEVLVPVMRKSRVAKALVRTLMTDPMVYCGKWYYEGRGFGWIFYPLTTAWFKVYDYLGQDHKFVRENGEIV